MQGPIPNDKQLGEAIRKMRQEKTNLTIEKFALEAGTDYSYLSDIERLGRNLTWDKLTSIAKLLDTDVSELVAEAEAIARRQQGKPVDDSTDA